MSKREAGLMEGRQKKISILIADDDEDDCMLAHEALIESHLQHELHVVKDGEELMDYLYRRGKFTNLENASLPGLILLDLNMPKKDGREALKEIKSNPTFKHIPVVILTTSKAAEDIQLSYSLGANSFIIKPVTFASLVEVMKTIGKYWFDIVELPY